MNTKNEPTMPIVRIPDFDVKGELEGHYFGNNPLLTHILNAMHIIFPEGEQLFIRSVKFFVADLKQNPELKKRVKAFIGQEKQHQLQHQDLWKKLDEIGLDAQTFADWYHSNAYDGLEGLIAKILPEKSYHKVALAVTAALEHWTATMAEFALEKNQEVLNDLPPNMANLLAWHAGEEIEHKSVTYDLLQEVDDSYTLRVAGFAIGSAALFYYAAAGTVFFAAKDKSLSLLDLPKSLFKTRDKLAGLLGKVLPELYEYMRPDFHPTQMDNDHLAEQIFAKLQIAS